jgi:primosomal protein N' (replication factor Y) (superfamily II helicase)
VADLKPLKLKVQSAQLARPLAKEQPFVRVLVDHQIPHLEHTYEYTLAEEMEGHAQVGALVELEFGHALTQGIILSRSAQRETAGSLKQVRKILSHEPYVMADQLSLISTASDLYGASEWDFVRGTVPAFSKQGERRYADQGMAKRAVQRQTQLPSSLHEFLTGAIQLICAVEVPISTPYWRIAIDIGIEREKFGPVLLLLPNERELNLFESELMELGIEPITIRSNDPKSERYVSYLRGRSTTSGFILGTRSSALLPLPPGGNIIVVDEVDESHYERRSPTWNTRELVQLREEENSVIYVSSSISTEMADRIDQGEMNLYRFPQPRLPAFHSESSEREQNYFPLIQKGLQSGSVLISVLGSGYVTAFSCQKCRNIALCTCGGKLFIPGLSKNPRCSTCTTEQIEWKCSWCQESKPRVLGTGVIRRAEEFGRAFPRNTVITSNSANPVSKLPDGHHLVISTPGVEPRGIYAAQIFLDLEMQLSRTTLRSKEDLRLQILRNLSCLAPGGSVYFSLLPSDSFLQSILRGNPLLAAHREIEERDSASLPPHFIAVLISGDSLEPITKVLSELPHLQLIGPFPRNKRKTLLVKAPTSERAKLVQLLSRVNRVQSMRKEPLLTYQINPYSLN